jgi:predicted transposase YbfD/YdcC
VVTADALQTHAQAAEFLVTVKQADYLFTVKANQPTLLDRCAGLPWHQVPLLDRTRDQAHGRVEIGTLKAVTVGGFGFPHSAQVLQVTRKTRNPRTRRWHTTTVYAVTSLTFQQASPARLADLLRGHWGIENGLHHVRDATFAEDASQVRTGTAPPSCHGDLAQPGHRRAVPRRAGQPRRRAPLSQPRPPPTPDHPRHQPGMQPTIARITKALRFPVTCTYAGRAAAQPCRSSSNSRRGGLVPMTTVAESSSELATRAISPSWMKVSAACGA